MTIPDPIQIPAYVPSFAPVPQITPFTYRDGVTALNKLDAFSNYLNKVIVPFINDGNAALSAAVEEDINNMLTLVNEAVAAIIGSSVEVQDAVVAGIFEDSASATRVFTDTLYAAKSVVDGINTIINTGRLSQTALDAAYAALADFTALETMVTDLSATVALKADKTYVDTQDDNIQTDLNGTKTRVTALETLTTTGRLGSASLDSTYVKIPTNVHAVFIGSSNSTPGTWVEDFAAQMGYIAHNYSIGGGSFTGAGPGAFDAQVAAAIADNSYDHSLVKYFFICDVGNDIRAIANVQSYAVNVFNAISTGYVNAKIIVLPAVWGNCPTLNNIGARLASIGLRNAELVNAAQNFNVGIVDGSWRWLADAGDWMKPGEVHCNTAGYARVADFMVKYMRGESIDYDQGQTLITAQAAIAGDQSYWNVGRIRDTVFIQNNFWLNSAVAIDTDLGQLPYGTYPQIVQYVPVVNTARAIAGSIAIFENGLIRSLSTLAAESYFVNHTYRAF